jgi:hypothetical protein
MAERYPLRERSLRGTPWRSPAPASARPCAAPAARRRLAVNRSAQAEQRRPRVELFLASRTETRTDQDERGENGGRQPNRPRYVYERAAEEVSA